MASTISWNSFPPSYIVADWSLSWRAVYSEGYTTTTSSSMSIWSAANALTYEEIRRQYDEHMQRSTHAIDASRYGGWWSEEQQQQSEALNKLKDFFDTIEIYVDERWVAHSKPKKVKKNKSVFDIIKALW